jgi:hypothetical protein
LRNRRVDEAMEALLCGLPLEQEPKAGERIRHRRRDLALGQLADEAQV